MRGEHAHKAVSPSIYLKRQDLKIEILSASSRLMSMGLPPSDAVRKMSVCMHFCVCVCVGGFVVAVPLYLHISKKDFTFHVDPCGYYLCMVW